MAAPFVSGVAALVWMYRPTLSSAQVREIILKGVVEKPDLKGKIRTAGLLNAKNALEAAWAFDPPRPPKHAPQAIHFEDKDPRVDLVAGTVTITAAKDESDIDYYRVYFVSGAGFQLQAFGDEIPASGDEILTLQIDEPVVVPHFAEMLVAVAGRKSGQAKVHADAPAHVELIDYAKPLFQPRSLVWQGDTDARANYVQGTLAIGRARDETSISQYNIYWAKEADGGHGDYVGSVEAVGFKEPRCEGKACSRIQTTKVGNKYRYVRSYYMNNEQATIFAVGPASIVVQHLQTEDYYDTLQIGRHKLGGLKKDMKLDIPEGPFTINWVSDQSVTNAGWSFEMEQTGAVASFELAAQPLQGTGLKVYPAHLETESSEGTFAKIEDCAADSCAANSLKALLAEEPLQAAALTSASASEEEMEAEEALDAEHMAVPVSLLLSEASSQANQGQEELQTTDVVWEREASAQDPMQASIRSTFTVLGVEPELVADSTAREAVRRAIASSLPPAGQLQLVRVAALEKEGGAAVEVELEAAPARATARAVLDRAQGELLLLGLGGAANAELRRALASELKAADVPLQGTPVVHVGAPRLYSLAARYASVGALRRRLQEEEEDSDDEGAEAASGAFAAIAVAMGLFAATAIAFGVLVGGRAMLRRSFARAGRGTPQNPEANLDRRLASTSETLPEPCIGIVVQDLADSILHDSDE